MGINIRNLAINYIVSNPVIPQGEFALELDTNKVKLGDGITKWNNLGYFGLGGGSSTENSINLIDAISGNQTYTLPTAVGISGNVYVIKKIDSSSNTVTIATTSSQTIDGYSTITFSNQYQCYSIVSNGTNWYIISIF